MPIATGAAQIEAENNQLFMPVTPPLVFPGNQKLPNGKTPGYVPTLEEEAKAADKGKPIDGGDADLGLLVNFGDQVKEFGEKVADRGMQALCQANPLACVSNVIMQVDKDASIPTGKEANNTSKAVELTFDKGTRTWTTPAGIEYGPGSVHGNRVQHVLDHVVPNPTKTTHSVFNVDRKEVLRLVDEAWLAKSNPLPNDPGVYVVPMGRAIGTAGETNIKIIVRPGTNKIITAYPFQ